MSVDTSIITSGIDQARAKIAGTIKNAANATGAGFEYLLSAAKIESNLNPTAAASTSSARGLFQFIEQTWLGTVKEAGAAFGFGKYADAISKTPSGNYTVNDSATRDEILKLRDDPAASAAMAGALTQSNGFKLSGALGRRPTDGELYIAHFMGAGGAAKLITSAEGNPHASGAALFPSAAAANRPIFYNRDGSARSVSEVYSVLTSRFEGAADSQATRMAVASSGGAPGSRITSVPIDNTNLSNFQIPATERVAALKAPDGPIFHSLFQAGDRTEPVSPAVRELWGNGASLTSNASPPGQTGSSGPKPLDLFSDPNGTFSG